MKKILLSIAAFCLVIGLSAQDLSTKIPSNAAAVVTVKGEKLTKLVSVEDFSTTKLGEMLGKELHKMSKGEIENIANSGFDLEKNFYYFLDIQEGVFTNCFLIPLKEAKMFESLLRKNDKEKVISENGVSYFQNDYDGTTTLWNNNTLIVMFTKEQTSPYDYYDDYGYYEELEETAAAQDAVAAAATAVEESAVEKIEEVEQEEESPVESAIEAVREAAGETDEDMTVDDTTETYDDYYNSDEYKRLQAEREEKQKEREAERATKRKELAEATLEKAKEVMAGNYAQGNIMRNPSYAKSMGNGGEEASAWIADFGQVYESALPTGYLFGASSPYSFMDIQKFYGGMSVAAKLDFEEDHAAIKTVYTMNDKMADTYKKIYNGKFNPKFANYLNEDRMLGYWSMNMNVEGMLKAYPDLIDNMFDTKEANEYSDIASLATHLFAVLIDEEAAAEIVRGDMLLVLTDLAERTVTYTDYEYDEDYNYKEVERTKTETIPDFMFMFSSEQKELFNRLVRIGIRQDELEPINGMYKLKTMGSSSPFDLYVMFKDDMFFMGSSKRDMIAINNGTYTSKLSGGLRRNMRKNVSSMYVNGKKIVAQIPVDSYPSDLRSKIGFLTQNTEDVLFNFEKIKGNTMKGEMIWNTTTEGHNNSFDYFLNMIEGLID